MRIYKNLNERSITELKQLLDNVKTHSELTIEEKRINIENIESILRINVPRLDILEDIRNSQADLDDVLGN